MKTVYVMNDDESMIYKVNLSSVVPNTEGLAGYVNYDLELVCGQEYIHEDYDIQGWCAPDYFIDDVQYEHLIQYFEEESFDDLLASEGYRRAELPDHIYQWGEKPSELSMLW